MMIDDDDDDDDDNDDLTNMFVITQPVYVFTCDRYRYAMYC